MGAHFVCYLCHDLIVDTEIKYEAKGLSPALKSVQGISPAQKNTRLHAFEVRTKFWPELQKY